LALDSDVSRVLAPSGKLRAGLYTGTSEIISSALVRAAIDRAGLKGALDP